jgi:ferredoxin
MHDKYILQKDHLKSFLRKLGKEYRLVGPVKNRHGDTLFTEIDDIDSCSLDFDEQPQNSIKQFLLPQQEELYTYDSTDGKYEFITDEASKKPSVYFGVHACDLSAVLYMDVIFSQKYRDNFYREKRRNSVFIGINCNNPLEKCFCNNTGHGPFLEYGADLQMTDLGDRFYLETGRAQGEELVEQWKQFFSPAEEKDTKAQYQCFLEARGRFKRQVHVDQAIKQLQDKKVPLAVWQKLSIRCQDCGGCAFICPTCTCFTITDQPRSATAGVRLRSWDACTFAGFTRMAGGHNPVEQKTQAIRQRFMHKLYYDVKKHGRPSCVGCGRCVGICFGGTDIVRFIEMASNGF